jgi:hypothetical protein
MLIVNYNNLDDLLVLENKLSFLDTIPLRLEVCNIRIGNILSENR